MPISPPAFAVVGMAGVVGGATGAAITAIVMIFEMTLDYNVILTMTVTVAISYGMRKFLCMHRIYSLKLTRRGRHMPEALQANFPMVRLARDIMEKSLAVVPASTRLETLSQALSGQADGEYLLVENQGVLVGVIKHNSALQCLARSGAATPILELPSERFEIVTENTALFDVVTKMHARNASLFLVASGLAPVSVQDIKGVISKERIADVLTETIRHSRE